MDSLDLTSLVAVLSFLAGPAGVAAWMMFVSDTFRNWRDEGLLGKFSPLGIQAAITASSFVPPVLAYTILAIVPKETLELLQPYYAFAASLFLGFVGQKIWYRLNKQT